MEGRRGTVADVNSESMDAIAEMAGVTYKRLEFAMENPKTAISNEAWELIAALVEVLQQQNTIPKQKRLEYAKGIRDFSQEMYLEKLARPRGEGQYSHCGELIRYWLIGKSLVESLEKTSQPIGKRLVCKAGKVFFKTEYKD